MNETIRDRQRGATDWGAVVSLVFLVALIFALWNVGPVYIRHFQFVDEVEGAARAYPRNEDGNKRTHERIWKKVVELQLDKYMYESDIEVSLAGTERVVIYYYEREATVLPGWKRTFKFQDEVRQPLL